MESPEADGVVAQVETETTWREALSTLLRAGDHHVSDEEIFAILNGGSDEVSPAELCAARGVTLPMYCVWKSKYRQLDLDQLRTARRREQRRRQAVNGLGLCAAALLTGGIVFSLAWVVSSTFKVMAESTLAIPATASADRPSPLSGSGDSSPAPARARELAPAESRSNVRTAPPSDPATIVETGYRIQVRAAESAREGRTVVAQLAAKGYPAYVTRAVVGNSEVFRVRIGPFDTLAVAEEIASQLRSDGFAGAWIAR